MIILRLIHIVAGAFWAGSALMLTLVIQPGVRKAGPGTERALPMAQISLAMSIAALLTTAAGLLLHGLVSRFVWGWIVSPLGIGLTLGSLAGLAAAIGREFTLPVLARASDQDEASLVRSLDELWQRHIVVNASGQRSEAYDFTHAKLREVVYNNLSAARRRLLHRRIAEALEIVHAQTIDAVSAQVAAHYVLAGRFQQAILHYRRAAEVARRVYANSDAIRAYRHAIALLASVELAPELAAGLHEGLGDGLHLTSQHAEVRAAYRQAMATANQAWLAWCAFYLIQTQALSRASLALWDQLPLGRRSAPFLWLALWPLIAVTLHDEQLSQAVEHVRTMLGPGQQRPPDALAASLEQAIQAWEAGAPETAQVLLHQSMGLAQRMHYL